MSKLFIFVGASASGKTTLEDRLIENNLVSRLVSSTNREKREGEVEGIDYYFRPYNEIKNDDNVLEIHITKDWMYAVSPKELLKKRKLPLIYSVINIKPAEDLINYIKNNNLDIQPILVFFDIEKDQRIELLKKRGESEEDILIRLAREDKKSDFNIKPDFFIKDIYSSYEVFTKAYKEVLCP